MKIVVTGGAGFVGSNIAETVNSEADIHVVDDLSTGRRRNVPGEATFHETSILDTEYLEKVFQDARYVYHQAALPSVPRSVKDPVSTNEANVDGTLSVLQAARSTSVEKVVYAASSSAYGNSPRLPKEEEMKPDPLSPYAVSKLSGEQYCRAFHEVYGLRTTALRYFNIYGPKQDPEGEYAAVIPTFIRQALQNKPITVHGDGTQTRDFTYVADAVRANRLAARSEAADGHTINVGAGGRISILELAETIRDLTGSNSEIKHLPRREGDVDDSLASLEKAEELTGYEPQFDLEEGLEHTIRYFEPEYGG